MQLSVSHTDRIEGNRSNRVIGSDMRLVWKDVYTLSLQGALSRTEAANTAISAPLWQGTFARAGRRAGYGNTLANPDEDPRAARLQRTRDGFFLKLSYLFRL